MARQKKTLLVQDVDRGRLSRAIKEALAHKGMTQAELAGVMGVSAPTVSGWINQKISPGHENLLQLIDLLDLDETFLTSGQNVERKAAKDEDDLVFVPHYGHVSAGAGYENGLDDIGGHYFPRTELRRLTNTNPDTLRTIVVVGNSMEPEIRANDTVYFIEVDRILDHGIYILEVDGDRMVKEVQRLGGRALELIPRNTTYSRERFIPLEDADTPNLYRSDLSGLPTQIRVIGKVVSYNKSA